MISFLRLPAVAWLPVVLCCPALAQVSSVSRLGITKTYFYEQTNPVTLVPGGAEFHAFVEGERLSNNFPSSSINVRNPIGYLDSLWFDGDHGAWYFEDEYDSHSELDDDYPNGAYELQVGSTAIATGISAGADPKPPLIGFTAGGWRDGVLKITDAEAAQGFSVVTNANTGNGFLGLEIEDEEEEDEVFSINLIPDSTSNKDEKLDIALEPGLLKPGHTYHLTVEFDHMASRRKLIEPSWIDLDPTAEGTFVFGMRSVATTVVIEVVTSRPGTPYENYLASYGLDPEEHTDPLSDYDHDGTPDILEAVLGGNPTGSIGDNRPTVEPPFLGVGKLGYHYLRDKGMVGIPVEVEYSHDFSLWITAKDGVDGVTTEVISVDSKMEMVVTRIPVATGARFVRLKAVH